MSTSVDRPYHHGNLAQALLDAAAELVAERGPSGVSLREVARRVGVSHSAPAHHFGDKAGLLAALAREGFRRFGDALREADERHAHAPPDRRCLEVGVAYVRFATQNAAYFAIMWRPDVQDCDDRTMQEHAAVAGAVLARNVAAMQEAGWASEAEPDAAKLHAWALVHGLATLANDGVIERNTPTVLEEVVRSTLEIMVLGKGGLAS